MKITRRIYFLSKCYRRDRLEYAWKFRSEPKEICVCNQWRAPGTGVYVEENSKETLAVLPVEIAVDRKTES
jgi:hypothetical protein